MRQLAAAASPDLGKHRQWHWCRRPNGFSAMAKWHVVAGRLSMPPYQVIAFVNRLEELANAGEPRGYVGTFDAAEIGRDLGMPALEAARIFAALEEGESPWIVSEHVANFYDRNPDREDPTVNERNRRRLARSGVLKKLAKLAGLGRVDPDVRAEIETTLALMSDAELFMLHMEVGRALSTGLHVTRDTRSSRRDIVTITPEQSRHKQTPSGDNSGDKASGEPAGLSEDRGGQDGDDQQAAAALWLATEGERIVTERMMEPRTLAATRIARWRDQQLGGDSVALAAIIRAVDGTDYVGPRFHNLVVDRIKHAPREAAAQAELKLPPVLASERKMA